jgi:hypothetical protein
VVRQAGMVIPTNAKAFASLRQLRTLAAPLSLWYRRLGYTINRIILVVEAALIGIKITIEDKVSYEDFLIANL